MGLKASSISHGHDRTIRLDHKPASNDRLATATCQTHVPAMQQQAPWLPGIMSGSPETTSPAASVNEGQLESTNSTSIAKSAEAQISEFDNFAGPTFHITVLQSEESAAHCSG